MNPSPPPPPPHQHKKMSTEQDKLLLIHEAQGFVVFLSHCMIQSFKSLVLENSKFLCPYIT